MNLFYTESCRHEYAINPEEINTVIKNVHGVKNVSRIRSRWIGNTCAVDLVISVAPALSTEDSHKIADEVEKLIEKDFNVTDISIHVEPENG